jgi:hypothetical protein
VLKASTLSDQTKSLKARGEQLTQDEGFKEVCRHKWHYIDEAAQTSKKAAVQDKMSEMLSTPSKEVIT